jgi:type II secretory pathway predicted ATPase ExeA
VYEQFFGLSRRPFAPTPTPDCIVAHESYLHARNSLERCLTDGSGTALLTASAGLGKSLLCQDLMSRLEDRAKVVYLCSGKFPTRKSLLQAILFELHAEFRGLSEDEARLELLHQARSQANGGGLVILVDEAHLVPNELLEELRTISESAGSTHPIRILLCGQVELEERLADGELQTLNQRIGCHAILDPLTRAESLHFLEERLKRAGRGLDLLAEEAVDLVIRVCDGNPRLLLQLCDHALLSAYTADEKTVSLETFENALQDLKALPLHWNDVGLASNRWQEADEESETATAVSEVVHPSIPATTASADESDAVMGVVEVGATPSVQHPEATLFGSVTPWVASATPVPEVTTDCANVETPVTSKPIERPGLQAFSEQRIEDRYAMLDDEAQNRTGGAIPAPPELFKFLEQFAAPQPAPRREPVASSPVESLPVQSAAPLAAEPNPALEVLDDDASFADELALLETIRELQQQLRTVAEEGAADVEPWQASVDTGYDVVEAPSIPVDEPRAQPAPPIESVAQARINEPVAVMSSGEPAGAKRFAQLFTRLRQRRRATQDRLAREGDVI